jgi:hypothetical protein
VIRRTMQKQHAPKRLWDYCGEWAAAIRRKTALDLPFLRDMTPEECLHTRSVDISAYAQFDWCSYVLPKSCRPIVRSSFMPLMRDELQSPEVKALIAEYDQKVNEKIGNDRSDEEVLKDDFPFIPPIPMDIFIDVDPEFDLFVSATMKGIL